MTPNAAKLKRICENNANLPVLFVSDPKNGDRFEFGTFEELRNELETWGEESEGDRISVQIEFTNDLRNSLDFEIYEGDHPHIKL